MHKFRFPAFLFLGLCTLPLHSALNDNSIQNSVQEPTKKAPTPQEQAQTTQPFTGKVTRNKVRLRLQPSLDAPILTELCRDDLLSVVSETDEFYAILPPKETKAYVFRTFVLDNVVEGNRVNVRLEPALESPVIAQLNSGDRVEGVVSPLNSKWLEINPPASTRFYVCKEYVEKIGSPAMLAQLEKRRTEVNALISSALLISDSELHKNYQDINIDAAIANLSTVIKQYSDFPKSVERAKELLSSIQDNYLQKKIAYLESRALAVESQINLQSSLPLVNPSSSSIMDSDVSSSGSSTDFIARDNTPPDDQSSNQIKRIPDWNQPFDPAAMSVKMTSWIPVERALYDNWNNQQQDRSPREFYEEQFADSVALKGIIESYARTIKNKPGDYLLVSPTTRLPIAYLYSTRIDLQDSIGKEVTLHGLSRPNNNFAFPAYYVISIE